MADGAIVRLRGARPLEWVRARFCLWLAQRVTDSSRDRRLVRGVSRPSDAINDAFDGADTTQGNSDEIVELDSSGIGDLETIGVDDAPRVDVEKAVGPQPPPWWDVAE